MSALRSATPRWISPVAILLVAVLGAVTVVLVARDHAHLRAERQVRAAIADATPSVASAMRGASNDASTGATPRARQLALGDPRPAGVDDDVAAQARDSGNPVLVDSGAGLVVVAMYDTPTTPTSVAERRQHLSGLRIVPMDLGSTLGSVRPSRGGISLSGPRRTVVSVPDARPPGDASYSVRFSPVLAPGWRLTVWTAAPPISPLAWLAALLILLAGATAAAWVFRRDERARESQQELVRLQEASATTAALATVAQQSLDLADLLPALTTELATALDLQGLSLGTPTADGERKFFAWGVTPATDVPASSVVPDRLASGRTLCLVLARGGRTVARMRVVAGRDLDSHALDSLGSATEVLTSALVNAEAFVQQRDLLERMKAVDELKTVFLATASHELRTPVSAITGYAQLLATSWDSLSADEARLYAEQVDSNARRLGALVEDLLDFSRLERGAGVVAPDSILDLGAVVTRILDEQPDLAPDHQVHHQAVAGLTVAGSEQAVERVVSNLVGNAAKYSPAGTVIRVSVTESHGHARLAVDDEGPGVPEAEREQIFSRFFRGRGDSVVATRGAGLGLAIVSEFAASMGGQVSVSAADGGGARFVVTYPLASASHSSVEGASDVRT
jgi:signal transduction histidine kinase